METKGEKGKKDGKISNNEGMRKRRKTGAKQRQRKKKDGNINGKKRGRKT